MEEEYFTACERLGYKEWDSESKQVRKEFCDDCEINEGCKDREE